MKSLMQFCRNWGTVYCYVEIRKYYPQKLEKEENFQAELQKKEIETADQICLGCAYKDFDFTGVECPTCKQGTLKQYFFNIGNDAANSLELPSRPITYYRCQKCGKIITEQELISV